MPFSPAETVSDFKTLFALISAVRRGEYAMPWGALIWVVVGIIYVFSPLDALPDFFFPLGIADDGAMLVFVWTRVHHVLSVFRQAQLQQRTIIEAEVVKPTDKKGEN